MKKIIGGKRYDTETAELVGSWSSGDSVSDFYYYSEDLYLKKTGEFFLYGDGNCLSPYRKSAGLNSWTGGEKIIPLTLDEAKKWVEEKESADIYESLFTIEEEENKEMVSLLIPVSLKNRLVEKSQKNGITMTEVIIKALEEHLK